MSGRRGWQGKVFIATSVDGYIARADGDIAWLTDPPPIAGHAKPPADPPVIPGYEEHLASVDHLVIGRGTYARRKLISTQPRVSSGRRVSCVRS